VNLAMGIALQVLNKNDFLTAYTTPTFFAWVSYLNLFLDLWQ